MKKTVWDWELLNDNKAIWLRPSSEVTETEYHNFYKAVSKVLLCVQPLPVLLKGYYSVTPRRIMQLHCAPSCPCAHDCSPSSCAAW